MSAWSAYEPIGSMDQNFMREPIQTKQVQAPSMMPGSFAQQQYGGQMAQMPHQAGVASPHVYPKETKNVPVPPVPEEGSKWKDISDYYEVADWIYIGIAVLIVDIVVLFLVRYFPDFFGKAINVWYNRFKLSAVIADVFIILIGFALSRYVYTEYIYEKYDWNPAYFTGLTVGIQIVHDVLFYFGVIKPIEPGRNAMMDVFKEYAASGGAKVVAADSAMMIGSSVLSMLLKAAPAHLVAFIGLMSVYTLPYILETRNQFSSIV
jgi:hypothetical protein